jgi:MFS family permease
MSGDPTAQRSLWGLSALAFLGGLGGGAVFPILPVVGLALGIGPAMIGLILAFNRITRLAVNPLTGGLVDRFGARWPLLAGLCVEGFAALCFVAGLRSVHPIAWFLLGRALWGVGSSLLMVGSLTAALIVSESARRGKAAAMVRMWLSLGVPAGLALGGLVADLYSARAAFLSAAGITFGGMIAAYFIAPRKTAAQIHGVRHKRAERGAMRDLLRSRPLWMVWMFNFVVFFSVQGVILSALVLIIRDRHLLLGSLGPEGSSGMLMGAMIGASALASLGAGRWIDSHGRKAGLLLPASLCTVGGFGVLAVSSRLSAAVLGLTAIGIGLGGINIPLIIILGDLVSADRYGRAIGIYQVLGDVGGALGPIIGLEAVSRFGATRSLTALTVALLVTVPLSIALQRREQAAYDRA